MNPKLTQDLIATMMSLEDEITAHEANGLVDECEIPVRIETVRRLIRAIGKLSEIVAERALETDERMNLIEQNHRRLIRAIGKLSEIVAERKHLDD